MRKMIVSAIVIGLLSAAGFSQATSQPAGPRGQRGHELGKFMGKKLNLTDQQKAQIKAILQQAHQDAQQAKDVQAKKAIYQAAAQKIKTDVLTDAQRQQLQEIRKEHQAGAAGAGKGLKALNLTDDQKAKIKAIMQEARQKIHDQVLTDEQRKIVDQRRAARGAAPAAPAAPAQ